MNRPPLPEDHSERLSWLPEACVAPVERPLPRRGRPQALPAELHAGERIGDFRILAPLGSGSFARVFLAEQESLGRRVALKVSAAGVCHEARLLAGLEHDHIVGVFSETIDPATGWMLLCMQYVPGLSLDHVLERVGAAGDAWSGRTILEAVGDQSVPERMLTASALRDRQALEQADRFAAVCLFGARLAEALAHAHARRILHRDIKPANILVDSFGRPLLADFNLSCDAEDGLPTGSGLFGGSVAYMSPEHLDAFNPHHPVGPEVVDTRSDLYSLGVVLFEMVTGRRPWSAAGRDLRRPDALAELADERRRAVPSVRDDAPEIPLPLEQVIRRCLAHDPGQRYQSASELAKALHGAMGLLHIRRQLPRHGRWERWSHRRPFLCLLLLMLVPQLAGSAINITYNATQIVAHLTPSQAEIFYRLVLSYNLLAYPAAAAVIYRLMMPAYRAWMRLRSADDWAGGEMDRTRHLVVSWPRWAIRLSCAGWLPGMVLFPGLIGWWAGPLPFGVLGHFVASFTISCLVCLTYSFFAAQFVTVELLYPRLWLETWSPQQTARLELAHVGRSLRVFQHLAGLVPLAAALVLLLSGPNRLESMFRLVIGGLILAGSLGFAIAVMVVGRLQRVLAILTATADAPSGL